MGLGADTEETRVLYMVSGRGEFSSVASLSVRINLDGLPFPVSLSPSHYPCVYWPVLLDHHFPHGFRGNLVNDQFVFSSTNCKPTSVTQRGLSIFTFYLWPPFWPE